MPEDFDFVVQTYEDLRGEWRWRVVATNGQVVGGSGEGYVTQIHAEKMAVRLFGNPDTKYVLDFEGQEN